MPEEIAKRTSSNVLRGTGDCAYGTRGQHSSAARDYIDPPIDEFAVFDALSTPTGFAFTVLQHVQKAGSWSLTRHVGIQAQRPTAGLEEMLREIVQALADDPLEDGQRHETEALLKECIAAHGGEPTRSAIEAKLDRGGEQDELAGLIRVLGRLGNCALPWGVGIAELALQNSSPLVRGAGIRALEMWGTDAARSALRSHTDGANWLSERVRRILAR